MWIVLLIIVLVLIPVVKEVISDIDYKRQLSGKIPPRTTVKDSRRSPANDVINANGANPELDSINASAKSESFANNTSGIL